MDVDESIQRRTPERSMVLRRQRAIRHILESRKQAVPVEHAVRAAADATGSTPEEAKRWLREVDVTRSLYALLVMRYGLARDPTLSAYEHKLSHIARLKVTNNLLSGRWSHEPMQGNPGRTALVDERWDDPMDHRRDPAPEAERQLGPGEDAWLTRLIGRYDPSRGLVRHVDANRMDGEQAVDEIRDLQEFNCYQKERALDDQHAGAHSRAGGRRAGMHPQADGLAETYEGSAPAAPHDEIDRAELARVCRALPEPDRLLVLLRYFGVRVKLADGRTGVLFGWRDIAQEMARRGHKHGTAGAARQRFHRLAEDAPLLKQIEPPTKPRKASVPDDPHLRENEEWLKAARVQLEALRDTDPLGYYAIVSVVDPSIDPVALLSRRHGIATHRRELVERRRALLAALETPKAELLELAATTRARDATAEPLPRKARKRRGHGVHAPAP